MVTRDLHRLTALSHVVERPPNVVGDEIALVELTLFELSKPLLVWKDCPADLIKILSSGEGPYGVVAMSGGSQPSRGHISDFPLFSALAAQPAPSGRAAARSAQAALVVAAFILATKSKLKDYGAALLSAGRSCRRLCAGKHVPPGLQEALSEVDSLSGALVAVDQIMMGDNILSGEQRRLLGGLHAFFSDALRFRPPRRRVATSALRVRKLRSKEVDDPTPEHEFFEEQEHSPTEEDIREGAAAVSESPGLQKVAIRLPPIFCNPAITPKQQILIAKVRSRAIASSAQGLLLSSDRLQLVDLDAMDAAVRSFLNGDWKPKPCLARGAFAASLSLLLGRPVVHLRQVVAVRDLRDVPHTFSAPHIVVSISAVARAAPKLTKAFRPTPTEASWYQPVNHRLVLQLPMGLACAQLVMREAQRHVGSKLIDGTSWEDDAAEFVLHVNQQKHSRLTLARIADFITRQAVAINGDWADAALLSGSGDANARLYYYCPNHGHLHNLWLDLWSGVAKGLRTELEMGNATARDGEGFCSLGCPTPTGVAQMVEGLAERCDEILRGRRSRERVRLLHNVLTVYTCLMVLWHAGIRAVTQPVELSLYDAATGFLGVSDKDTDVYYSSRIVWLPDVVQEQIAAYRQHLKGLQAQFSKKKGSAFKDELFLLGTNWQKLPVTGEAIRAELPDYPYRLNSQRHYLRTMLRKLGVRAQIVDALLGHGAPGQEPYATHSCLSPRRLRTEAGPALKKLSDMANWSVCRGLSP